MRLQQAVRTVRTAQRLVRDVDTLRTQLQRLLDPQQEQERQERPRGHGPHCRHCQLVEAYRLERDTQVRYAESLANGDEDYRPVTFKAWLTDNGREHRAIRDDQWAQEWGQA